MSDKNRTQLLEELANLEKRRLVLKQDKKTSARDYADQIKDVDDQIEQVLEDLKQAE